MSHESLGFLSGMFRNSQLRWATVVKEAFAILSTCPRLEYLLWNAVRIFFTHRSNLAYMRDPERTCRLCRKLQLKVWRVGRWS